MVAVLIMQSNLSANYFFWALASTLNCKKCGSANAVKLIDYRKVLLSNYLTRYPFDISNSR